MKVRRVTYHRGVTVNLGDFEFLRVDLEAEAELDDDESFDAAYRSLREKIKSSINAEVRRVVEQREPGRDDRTSGTT